MKKHIEKFALLGFLAAIVAFSWLKPLDMTAERQVEEGLKRALTSFAVARLLNGVISVAQGTEVSVAPGGLGANLTPGQILDPVNDLVEQFSELMLIASVAFGIMKILLGMGSFWIFSAILSGVALVWAAFKLTGRIPPILLTKFLLVLIFVRFSVPVVAVGSDIISKQFLEDKFNESQMAIENGKKQLAPFEPSVGMPQPAEVIPSTVPSQPEAMQPAQEKGWLAGLKDIVKEVKQSYDPRPYIKNLETRAGELVNHIINLIVVFVLQTIVIPLVLMWALYRSCLALIHSAELKKQLPVAA
jgi:hypothetical protein